jgi:hypothetical protein
MAIFFIKVSFLAENYQRDATPGGGDFPFVI